MARIFNIYFIYEEELHSAIVSERSTPLYTEYILGNLDRDLRILLPGTAISFKRSGFLDFNDAGENHSQTLMNSILQSLAKHLQSSHSSL